MNKLTLFSILIILSQIIKSQPPDKILNCYFLRYQLLPLSYSELFVESQLSGDIESIRLNVNDTNNFLIQFKKNRIHNINSDSTRAILSYRFDRLSKITLLYNDSIIDRTRFIRVFPFIWILNDGLSNSAYKGFGNINSIKSYNGLTTFTKSKFRYRNGRVHKSKIFGWQPVSQKCYYFGYDLFDYTNDTTVVERSFDSNDSLACTTTFHFDNFGNIKKIESLTKKRVKGWGIDVTYYSYDANIPEATIFKYEFDKYGNWISQKEIKNDTLQNHIIRHIKYKK
jgi:hypothetical protein